MNSTSKGTAAHELEQAGLWLAQLDAGTADRDAFEAWRNASARNAAAFAQVAAVWSAADRAKRLTHGQLGAKQLPATAQPVSRRRFLSAAAAAGGVLIGAGFLVGHAYARESAITGVGERRLVRLPDGCQLDLNTDTKVSWRYLRHSREFWLERGEASLIIARDESRPCTLYCDHGQAQLAAGQFNARRRDAALELLVISGEGIWVAPESLVRAKELPPAGLRVAAGESLRAAPDAVTKESEAPESLAARQAWRRGEIVFAGDTLAVAVAEYNRYLTKKLVIADPALQSLRIGGRFTTNDPTPFLNGLRASFGVRSRERAADTIELTQ